MHIADFASCLSFWADLVLWFQVALDCTAHIFMGSACHHMSTHRCMLGPSPPVLCPFFSPFLLVCWLAFDTSLYVVYPVLKFKILFTAKFPRSKSFYSKSFQSNPCLQSKFNAWILLSLCFWLIVISTNSITHLAPFSQTSLCYI